LAFSGSPALSRKLHQDRIFHDILSKPLQEIRSFKWSLHLRAMAEQSAKLSQSKHSHSNDRAPPPKKSCETDFKSNKVSNITGRDSEDEADMKT
jgi:hypothetical protein